MHTKLRVLLLQMLKAEITKAYNREAGPESKTGVWVGQVSKNQSASQREMSIIIIIFLPSGSRREVFNFSRRVPAV